MTAAEVETLLDHVRGTRLYAPIIFGATTGVRPGELLALRWADVVLDGDRPSFRILKSKTDAGRRQVGLIPRTVEALRQHRTEQDLRRGYLDEAWQDLDLVFPSEIGTPWCQDNHRRLFTKACREAGIGQWSPHELRHTCATLLMEGDVSLQFVAQVLGHSSVAITYDVYGHLQLPPVQVFEAMNKQLGGRT
nr:site-specific integrase [Rhabdothermincola salaria]